MDNQYVLYVSGHFIKTFRAKEEAIEIAERLEPLANQNGDFMCIQQESRSLIWSNRKELNNEQ